jgi:tellurite resistance protein
MEKADVPTVAAALAALLVAADGEIKSDEKAVATQLGARMFPGFSPLVFETLLEGMEELPSAGELAGRLTDLVDEDGKRAIMEYLVALANVDSKVSALEKEQIVQVAQALGTAMPALSTSQG